jgi:hypothetical protein
MRNARNKPDGFRQSSGRSHDERSAMVKLKSPEEVKKAMLQQDASIKQLLIDAGKEIHSVDKALSEAAKLEGIAKQEKD